MNFSVLPRLAGLLAAGVFLAALFFGQNLWKRDAVPAGFAKSNGRIEATQIDVATRLPGRIKDVSVRQGDFLKAGQEVARMDTAWLDAQLREAEAGLARATIGVGAAKSLVQQYEAEKEAAVAVVAQREALRDAAKNQSERSETLAARGTTSQQRLDEDKARYFESEAAVKAAQAQVAAAEAAIGYARTQVVSAESSVEAAQATIARIKTDIDDSVLKSPREGRVQYTVAQVGEVLPAGGVVANLVDLSDVYMTFFLPTSEAGRTALGAEVHLVLDAAPQFVIPARVSFVADVAQFTPKSVETEVEREKLMFQVRAHIDADLLRQHIQQVKTGLPGVAYVRLDPSVPWPAELDVRLPQ